MKLRIITMDHYLSKPHPLLDQPNTQFRVLESNEYSSNFKVPVLRVFGVSELGQKACLHIHQVYPYIYIPFAKENLEGLDMYIHQLGHSINHAVHYSFQYNQNGHGNKEKSNSQFIMSIHLVKGIRFYGFSSGYEYFLKIYLLNPQIQSRLVTLLEEGAVMGEKFEVFDNYQYIQQFMIDYNLAGMDWIDFDFFKFRLPILSIDRELKKVNILSSGLSWYRQSSVKSSHSWAPENGIVRTSYCELELDTWSCDILNRLKVKERPMKALVTRESLTCQSIIPSNIPLVPSLAAVWKDEINRREKLGIEEYKGSSCLDSSQSRFPYTPWKGEEHYRTIMKDAISKAKTNETVPKESINASLANQSLFNKPVEDDIPTAFQGISLLHPPKQSFSKDSVDFEFSIPSSQTFQSSQFSSIDKIIIDKDICSQKEIQKEIYTQEAKLILEQMADEDDEDMENIKHENIKDSSDVFDGLLEEMQNFSNPDEDDIEETIFPKQDASFNENNSFIVSSAKGTKRKVSDAFPEAKSQEKPLNSLHKRKRIPQIDGSFDSPYVKNKSSRKVRFSRKTSRQVDQIEIGNFPKSLLNDGIYRGGLWSPTKMDPTSTDVLFDSNRPIPTSPTMEIAPVHSSVTISKELKPLYQYTKSTRQRKPPIILNLFDNSAEHDFNFSISGNNQQDFRKMLFRLYPNPPSASKLLASLSDFKIPSTIYTEPFVSNRQDAPQKVMMHRKEHIINDSDISSLAPFDMMHGLYQGIRFWSKIHPLETNLKEKQNFKYITNFRQPPSHSAVKLWLKEKPDLNIKLSKAHVSQLEHPTLKNRHGFKFSQTQISSLNVEKHCLIILSLELHVQTSTSLLPNPEKDPISAIFCCIQSDDDSRMNFLKNSNNSHHVAVFAIRNEKIDMAKSGLSGYALTLVSNERELFDTLISFVRNLDPDILCGWEIQKSSWGYAVQRAKYLFNRDICLELSRVVPDFSNSHSLKEEDEWGHVKQSSLYTSGRIFLNVWRIMRKELALTSYTLENIVFHILHQRIPKFTNQTLSQWFGKGMLFRWRTMKYYIERTKLTIELLNKVEWINQTSEFARVYGVLLYSVLIRGSQFKVEAVMARIARPENFMLNSPSRKRVRMMRAAKSIALNKEPVSQLYANPVAVLDFQSLYPSLMIAYNYCYSTFLGFAGTLCDGNQLGAMEKFRIDPNVMQILQEHVNVAPNGMVFVKPYIRQGVLGRMVGEILDTRIMVKASMKLYKESKLLTRILHAKQLGLKLLANVTYGYTAASFSGRMPCSEIADAIVESGRATLERCIKFIHEESKWGAAVIYADTDSLFVSMLGKSKNEAFRIGHEITDTITKNNPIPIKLQFEKIYLPCVLLSKKRYVGFKYENAMERDPIFDAKGIETVRRDGCPAGSKCLESSLKILFRTKDLSLVKEYLYRQWNKILSGRVSVQDFIIAKEVKLGTYKSKKSLPNGAYIAEMKMAQDELAEPEYGDRVPYVIVNRKSKTSLRQSSVTPEEAANNPSLMLNSEYYIVKQIIAPLQRVFSLMGIDILKWYNEMPKVSRAIHYTDDYLAEKGQKQRITIDSYYKSKLCLICETNLVGNSKDVCQSCQEGESNKASSHLKILYNLRDSQDKFRKVQEICRSCTSHASALDAKSMCVSIDCPVYYSRAVASKKLQF